MSTASCPSNAAALSGPKTWRSLVADSDSLLDLSSGAGACALAGCTEAPVMTGTLPLDGEDRPAGLCGAHGARLGKVLANRTIPIPEPSLQTD